MKNICVVTGTRAEYGILKPLLSLLDKDGEINLDIVATAMHLEEKYGNTYKIIEQDGFKIAKKIPLDLKDTSKKTIIKSISILQIELSKYFEENNYDMVIILGDRYEMIAVANVALIYNIPICHLHGGEKTLGNFDESIRHSITKMSHIHLVSTDEYRKRVIQLGENPDNVVNIGAIGVENALKLKLLKKEELEEKLNIQLEEDYFVVLFHPVTLNSDISVEKQVTELLIALDRFDCQYIFIGSNSDTDSDKITEKIQEFLKNHKRCIKFTSLTTQEYHCLIKYSNGLIGNSSSGIIEVPSLNKPTLNVGDRQKGRACGNSVITVKTQVQDILDGIKKMKEVVDFENPYYKENSSKIAYEKIKESLKKGIKISKEFYDI